MGFAGLLKRLLHGNGIHWPAEKIAARQWDLLDRQKDCSMAMGFAGPLKILRCDNGKRQTAK
jgi:hypothetical protein